MDPDVLDPNPSSPSESFFSIDPVGNDASRVIVGLAVAGADALWSLGMAVAIDVLASSSLNCISDCSRVIGQLHVYLTSGSSP